MISRLPNSQSCRANLRLCINFSNVGQSTRFFLGFAVSLFMNASMLSVFSLYRYVHSFNAFKRCHISFAYKAR